MRRLKAFTTIAIVWTIGVANADPQPDANRVAAAKREPSNVHEPEILPGVDPVRVPVEAVAAAAAGLTFVRGRANLNVAAKTSLDPLVDTLLEHATLRLRIVGFASAGAQGDVARRRAEVVKWYLVDGGIAADRIDTSVSAENEPGKAIALQLGSIAAMADQRGTAPEADRSTRDATDLASILTDQAAGPRPRQVGANLDQMIEDARKQQVTIGGAGPGFRDGFRDDRPPQVGVKSSSGFNTVAPTLSVSAPKRGEDDHDRTFGALPTDHALPAVPAPPEVVHMLNGRYMGGLSRCYRKSLVGEVGVSKRVAMSFRINTTGAVVDPAIDGVDHDLDGCLRDQMTSWQFPVPREGPAETRFSITFVLQAN